MILIALGAFWVIAIKLWVVDGPKIPLIFISIWLLGFLTFSALGRNNGYLFLSFQTILVVILIVIERYKDAIARSERRQTSKSNNKFI